MTGVNGKRMTTTWMLVGAVLVAACSGSGGGTATLEVAGPTPSSSATLVCAADARGEIAAAIGLDAVRVSKPSWNVAQHVLQCDYDYPARAVMTLSVKELSSKGETTSYFDALGRTLGRTKTLSIGEGAFRTTNGSVVVRKDYKVLLVDVARLPAQFGVPPTGRNDIAANVGLVVMQCWAGG
jgi:hypothetical protein